VACFLGQSGIWRGTRTISFGAPAWRCLKQNLFQKISIYGISCIYIFPHKYERSLSFWVKVIVKFPNSGSKYCSRDPWRSWRLLWVLLPDGAECTSITFILGSRTHTHIVPGQTLLAKERVWVWIPLYPHTLTHRSIYTWTRSWKDSSVSKTSAREGFWS